MTKTEEIGLSMFLRCLPQNTVPWTLQHISWLSKQPVSNHVFQASCYMGSVKGSTERAKTHIGSRIYPFHGVLLTQVFNMQPDNFLLYCCIFMPDYFLEDLFERPA